MYEATQHNRKTKQNNMICPKIADIFKNVLGGIRTHDIRILGNALVNAPLTDQLHVQM